MSQTTKEYWCQVWRGFKDVLEGLKILSILIGIGLGIGLIAAIALYLAHLFVCFLALYFSPWAIGITIASIFGLITLIEFCHNRGGDMRY